ncbi:TPA: DNA polymerase delta subunit 4, variant 2 [Trebouxia sp. C0004]
MASYRLSETYRQSKREVGGAAHSSKSKASKSTVARQCNSVETPAEEQAQKLLRQFDLTAKYGPCTDVSRKQSCWTSRGLRSKQECSSGGSAPESLG